MVFQQGEHTITLVNASCDKPAVSKSILFLSRLGDYNHRLRHGVRQLHEALEERLECEKRAVQKTKMSYEYSCRILSAVQDRERKREQAIKNEEEESVQTDKASEDQEGDDLELRRAVKNLLKQKTQRWKGTPYTM